MQLCPPHCSGQRHVIRSVTGAGDYGRRVTDGTRRLVRSTVAGLRVCYWQCQDCGVSTLLPQAMVRDQQVPREARVATSHTSVLQAVWKYTRCLFVRQSSESHVFS